MGYVANFTCFPTVQ